MLLLLLSIGTSAITQNLKSELKKCHSIYSKAPSFKANINIKVSTSGNDGPDYTESGLILRKGDNALNSMSNTILMQNEKYSIMVIKSQKTILVKERIKNAEEGKMTQQWADNIDTLINALDSKIQYKYLGTENGNKHYRVFFEEGVFNTADIYISTEKQFLSRLVYHYNPAISGYSGSITTSFTNISTSPDFTANAFAESQFFIQHAGQKNPSAQYPGYKILEIADNVEPK